MHTHTHTHTHTYTHTHTHTHTHTTCNNNQIHTVRNIIQHFVKSSSLSDTQTFFSGLSQKHWDHLFVSSLNKHDINLQCLAYCIWSHWELSTSSGMSLKCSCQQRASNDVVIIWHNYLCSCWKCCDYTIPRGNNNNNWLFMVPHLVRAQNTYKAIRIHSFYHTHKHTQTPPHKPTHAHPHLYAPPPPPHTHTTHQIHALLVIDW